MKKIWYRQYLELKIAEINEQIEHLRQEKRKIHYAAYDRWIDDLLKEMIDIGIPDWSWQNLVECMNLKDLEREKIKLEYQLHPQTSAKYLSANDIERAKAVPIVDILGITNTRQRIRCPIHDDQHPSASWHKSRNMLKCFACNWYGDSIDLTMKLYNLDFLSAVKKLINV